MRHSDCYLRQPVRFAHDPRQIWTIDVIDGRWLHLSPSDGRRCGTTAESVEPAEDDVLPGVELSDARLAKALSRLGAGHAPSPGWDERTLRRAARPRHWSCWLCLALLAALVGAVITVAAGIWIGGVPLPATGPLAALLYVAGFAGWIGLGCAGLVWQWRR